MIAEIPVYLNQELAKKLYVLQYPLRPADRAYDDDLGMSPTHSCPGNLQSDSRIQ